MKTFAFTRSVCIDAPLEKVFAFHTDTENLKAITPPGITVKILRMDRPVAEGSRIDLEITQLGVTTPWHLHISRFVPGSEIEDTALDVGPFVSWRHHRSFAQEAGGTRMTDRVTFAPKGGIFGWLLLPGIYLFLARMFAFRHRWTRRLLEA